jgi:hypothetical protein
MGSDWADFNNDALPDLCVLDMTPPEHKRSKQNMASMRPDQFFKMVEIGWHHQYMTNTLQLNHGNGAFSEIAHLAGIDRTDWSWAPLFVDLNNDGLKDLFVTNGIRRDVTNNDFKEQIKGVIAERGQELDFDEVMGMIPTHVSDNLVFQNDGDLHFNNANSDWNYKHSVTSSGAAYADLDGDGDMDLITNNLDQPASVIRNTANDKRGSNYLQIELVGSSSNPFAIGTKATLYTDQGKQYLEMLHARGFQSSVEPLLHFGLGKANIDSLLIEWNDGKITLLKDIKKNERLKINRKDAGSSAKKAAVPKTLFTDMTLRSKLQHVHRESNFDDFLTEKLLPHRQSQHGPALATADVNGDGLDDIFVGASVGTTPILYLQSRDGTFAASNSQPWNANLKSEEIGALFFDADGDKDQDLYVAAGSTEFALGDKNYQDRLYVNDGLGKFSEAANALPSILTSTQVVAANDLDGDGDLDLFVGGRNMPGAYPKSPNSFILINEKGKFTNRTADWNTELNTAGMVTAALFVDVNNNGREDLIICSEWGAIRFFENSGKALKEITETVGDPQLKGWWYSLTAADLDKDGDLDLVAGNLGLNNKFHPTKEKPLDIYMNDFDGSGTNDIVLAKMSNNECVPVRGRECSSDQMPFLKDKFPTFSQFANADLNTIYGADKLKSAVHLQTTEMASMIMINEGGKFKFKALPKLAQVSPIMESVVADVNGDGNLDILVVGNMFGAEVETTRYDASIGTVLLGDGRLNFQPVPVTESGFFTPYNARNIRSIRTANGNRWVVGNNMGPLQVIGKN